MSFDDLKGCHVQAGKLTEWLKLSLDEPQLLETLGPPPIWACWCPARPASARRRWCGRSAPSAGSSNSTAPRSARWPPRTGCGPSPTRWPTVRDGGGVLLITDIDALLPTTARTRRHADPGRAAHRGGHPRRRVRRHLRGARRTRCPAARARSVRPRTRTDPARRHHPQAAARGAAAQRPAGEPRSRGNRRAHTGIRRRRSAGAGSRGGVAGRVAGQRRRQAARADPGGPDRGADRDPAAVAVGHRGGVGRFGDARRRRRHGRHQAGAHRGRAVAAAAPRHVRAARRGPAARRAALRAARVRKDVRGARARQHAAGCRCTRSRAPS